jgi:nucleotide-binding universal stress UspA family protein
MMKNIFIVTDFSDASKNAGLYGIELAKQFNADVVLFHAYQTPVQIPESYIFYTTEDVCETARQLLKQEADMINPGNRVKLEISCAEGIPSDTIISEAAKATSDLIICGMKGMAKAFRKIFGSTTSSLTRKSEIPLIVVPENAGFRLPKNIALASDLDPETSAATVELLKNLGEKFSAKLAVVWVVEEDFNAVNELRYRPAGFIKELKGLDPVFEFPTGSSITKALDHFVKDHDIDLMAMIPHKHDLLERFFTESITRKMIFHSHIPLLVLPQKKNGHTTNQMNGSHITETQG